MPLPADGRPLVDNCAAVLDNVGMSRPSIFEGRKHVGSREEGADVDEPDRAQAAELRARLNLGPRHTVVVALPPVERCTGTFAATWAAMLVEKVRPDVRLVIPAGGREQQRVRRLVRACRHEYMVRFADPDMSAAELAVLANIALFLPAREAPVSGLLSAMEVGCPIVAAAVPTVTEFLTGGHSAWLCRPDSPQDAARRLLQALDRPGESRRLAAAARADSCSPRLKPWATHSIRVPHG